MRKTLFIVGLVLAFGEALLLGLLSLDVFSEFPVSDWRTWVGFIIHMIPCFCVIGPAILAIWFRRTGGALLIAGGLILLGWWMTKGYFHWAAILTLPLPLVLAGAALLATGFMRRKAG